MASPRPSLLARRIFGPLLGLGLAVTVSACESTSTTSTGPSPVKCGVSLEAASTSIEASGGKGAIAVVTQPECSWTASSGATWITGITPASGQGNGRVEFQAAGNPTGTMRQSFIAINDQQVQLQQQPAPCRFEVSPLAPSIGAAGGTVTITVTALAGCRWQASGGAGWVEITTPSGTGAGSVSLRVAPSDDGETRSAAFLVAGQTVTLTQSFTATSPLPTPPGTTPPPTAPPGTPSTPLPGTPLCAYSLSATELWISEKGGSLSVAVSAGAGCAWTATSNDKWLVITQGATGSGNGTVQFDVEHGKKRTGTLTIAGQTLTVTQSKRDE